MSTPSPLQADGWTDVSALLDAGSQALRLGELAHSHTFECVRPPLLTAPSHGVAHF